MEKSRPQLPATIAANIEHFTGRTWLLPKILTWLEQSNERIFLLTGGPGTGKSMIMAWLAGFGALPDDAELGAQLEHIRARRVEAAHFCVANSGSTDPKSMAQNLANQLTRNVPGFADALKESMSDLVTIISNQKVEKMEAGASMTGVQISTLNLVGMSEELSFNRILREPLQKLYSNGYSEPMLLLVDGLDEALTYTGQTNIVRLLSKLEDLPPQVWMLFTTRPDPRVLKEFPETEPFDLVEDASKDVDDVQSYSYERLHALDDELRTKLANRIAIASIGNFLYAHVVIEDLLKRLPDIFDSASIRLPDGLGGLYHGFLNRELGKDEDRWYGQFEPVLGLIAVAQGEGLSRQLIESITGKDARGTLRICRQYLSGELPEGPFRCFHRSFVEWLLEDEDNVHYHIDGIQMHRYIANHYWNTHHQDWSGLKEPYGLNHLAIHLFQSEQLDRLANLIDQGWMAARFTGEGFRYAGFLGDIDLALKAVQAGEKAASSSSNELFDWPGLIRLGLIRTSFASLGHDFPPQILSRAVALGHWSPRQALDLAARLPAGAQRAMAYRLLVETGKLDEQEANEARAGMKAVELEPDDDSMDEAAESIVNLRSISGPEQRCTPELRAALERILVLESQGRLTFRTRIEAQKLNIPLRREDRREIEPPGEWESLLEALVTAYAPNAIGKDRVLAEDELLRKHLRVRIQFVAFNPAVERHPLIALALSWCWDQSLAETYAPAAMSLATAMPESLRIPVLENLVSFIPDAALPQMLQEVLHLRQGHSRLRLLGLLAPRLPADLLQQTLSALREIHGDEPARLRALLALLPSLEGDIHRQTAELALELAHTLPAADPDAMRSPRGEALLELIPLLPEALREETIQEAEKATGAVPFQENATRVAKAQAIAAVIPLHTGERRNELVEIALEMAYFPEEMAFRAPTLAVLYREMDPDLLADKLQGVWLRHEDEALSMQLKDAWITGHPPIYEIVARFLLHAIANTPLTPGITLRAFLGLAPDLVGVALDDAFAIIPRLYFSEDMQTKAFVAVAPRMDSQQAWRALESAKDLSSFRYQAAVIGAVASHLPESDQAGILAKGLNGALGLTDPADQAVALGALATGRPEWVCENASRLCEAAARLLHPDPILGRSAYLQRLTDLHPIWLVMAKSDTQQAISREMIEVCWRWQWR